LVELIGVKNEAKTIRLTRIVKETLEVILDTPSALTMGGRFKNTTPVTESAFSFSAILSRYFRQHDVFDAINYKERQKPSMRQSLRTKVNM
jgi:hypothetical protein